MKLKYYLRGLGFGVLLTVVLLSLTTKPTKKESLSEEEIIRLAENLGMEMKEKESIDYKSIKENLHENDQKSENEEKEKEAKSNEGSEEQNTGEDVTDSSEASDDKSKEVESGTDGTSKKKLSEDTTSSDKARSTNDKKTTSDSKDSQTTGASVKDEMKQKIKQDFEENAGITDKKVSNKKQLSTNASDDSTKTTKNSNSTKTEYANITVSKGMGSNQVAKLLESAKIIEDAKKFDQYLIKQGISKKILVGTYTLPKGADYDVIKKVITSR